jgi:putative DNA primase/helicase
VHNIVEHYGFDKNAMYAGQVFRIPGTVHNKRAPFMVHFYDETRIEVRFTELEAMAALDPLVPPKADRAKAKDQAHPHDDDIDVEKNLRILKECLSLIKPQQLIEDGQTYRVWLRVGFVAYHSTGGDPRALALWDTWSAQDEENYTEGMCQHKWETMETEREPLGLGTLVDLVREVIGDPQWRSPKPSPVPQSLIAKIEPEAYPLEGLPDILRKSVETVAQYNKAPVPLIASCALSALSLAGQHLVSVQRDELLHGPVSLNLLTIANSGERKTAADKLFMAPIRKWQEKRTQEMKPEVERYEAEHAAWESECASVNASIKAARKKGEPTEDLKEQLVQLRQSKPKCPRVPQLLVADETTEHLAWHLHSKWSSAGLISAEAGVMLGGHSMSKERRLTHFGLLNTLWDGEDYPVGRRTSESFLLRGARLTCGLQVQELTLREFMERSDGLARGTGFLSRYLISWPESTKGTRLYQKARNLDLAPLRAIQAQVLRLLELPVLVEEDGTLKPALAYLSEEAEQRWIEFHDNIEVRLGKDGELAEIDDVAAKAADNAVRLAALFQLLENDPTPDGLEISADNIVRASRVVAWHLWESLRFFGELAQPADIAAAIKLDGWLIAQCKRRQCSSIPRSHVRQSGPRPLRDGKQLEDALKVLIELDRVQLTRRGKQSLIEVNPSLLGEGQP